MNENHRGAEARRVGILFVLLPFLAWGLDAEQPNILLVTIDTLRADHLGCYGYQHMLFDYFQRRSIYLKLNRFASFQFWHQDRCIRLLQCLCQELDFSSEDSAGYLIIRF